MTLFVITAVQQHFVFLKAFILDSYTFHPKLCLVVKCLLEASSCYTMKCHPCGSMNFVKVKWWVFRPVGTYGHYMVPDQDSEGVWLTIQHQAFLCLFQFEECSIWPGNIMVGSHVLVCSASFSFLFLSYSFLPAMDRCREVWMQDCIGCPDWVISGQPPCSCRWSESMSVNCGHQWVYCSSPRW